jgi:site-specific DNA recombinase
LVSVQAKLTANAVARKVRLRDSTSILAGRIYNDRYNHMSPTHSNELGARYRYYVSHALLQNRRVEGGGRRRRARTKVRLWLR